MFMQRIVIHETIKASQLFNLEIFMGKLDEHEGWRDDNWASETAEVDCGYQDTLGWNDQLLYIPCVHAVQN